MQPWTIEHTELRTLLSMMQPNLSRITRYWCMYLSHEEGYNCSILIIVGHYFQGLESIWSWDHKYWTYYGLPPLKELVLIRGIDSKINELIIIIPNK